MTKSCLLSDPRSSRYRYHGPAILLWKHHLDKQKSQITWENTLRLNRRLTDWYLWVNSPRLIAIKAIRMSWPHNPTFQQAQQKKQPSDPVQGAQLLVTTMVTPSMPLPLGSLLRHDNHIYFFNSSHTSISQTLITGENSHTQMVVLFFSLHTPMAIIAITIIFIFEDFPTYSAVLSPFALRNRKISQ